MGVIHTVRLRRVSSGDQTFIEWITDFSTDATLEITEDARFKQRDNFAALRKEASKQFNFHSTAANVIAGYEGKNKVVMITGANSGIGLECARVFLLSGAHVIAGVRSPKDCEGIFSPLQAASPKHSKLDLLPLDLNSLESVRKFADSFKSMKLPLHILILNAGIMCIPQRTLTKEGFESQLGVNHIAHHLLTTLLLDVVKSSSPSRIVVLSSAAHRRSPIIWDDMNSAKSYDRWKAYGQSKTANILFAKQLQANLVSESKTKESKVDVFAVHPGAIPTALGRSMPSEDEKAMRSMPFRWKTIPQGAATTVVAAISPSLQGKGGIYMADCNEFTPLAHAADMEQAARLWAETEKMIATHK
jgi:NAD(P)-dependent dehydrogenase (short-subunit alcohol dehydrogenase family)